MSEPVAWTLAREGGELVYAVSSREAAEAWAANTDYHAAPIYTADAIRAAVTAERDAILMMLRAEIEWWEKFRGHKDYPDSRLDSYQDILYGAIEGIAKRGAA